MKSLLRLEGACYALAALFLYGMLGFSWLLFVILILVPDLSFLGYIKGPRAGAIAYNILHSTLAPWVLAALGYALAETHLEAIALIWFAHIGMDRALGYGLKHFSGFSDTHLGRIGRAGPAS